MPEKSSNRRDGKLSKAEQPWLLALFVLICIVTSLPYLMAYANQGESYRFSGFVFAVEDGNSYIAKMLAGASGAWLFKTPYTSQDQSGVLMMLPYLLIGKLAAAPGMHLQLVALNHLFRLAAVGLYLLASYEWIAWFIDDVRLRRLGVLLAAVGGGLGWLFLWLVPFLPGQSLPLEFYSPETFGFLGLYGLPHLALGRACLLWALLSSFRWLAKPAGAGHKGKFILQLGSFWMLAGIAQPLTFVLIGVLIAIYITIWTWQFISQNHASLRTLGFPWWQDLWRQRLAPFAAAAVLPVLFSLYHFWMILRDPFLQAWSAQNIIRSPHPLYYLLAFGLFVPYAWFGYRRLKEYDASEAAFLSTWIFISFVLAYFPVNLQRRLPEGVWMAWIVLSLAALSADRGTEKTANQRGRRLALAGLGLAFPSSLLMIWMGMMAAFNPSAPVFLPTSQVQAYEQFNQFAQRDQVVLSAFQTGNALPAYAPVRVVIGHGPESANLSELQPQIAAFFQAGTPHENRIQLICSQSVDYIFWGSHERALGDWQPMEMPGVNKIYENQDVQVFQVEVLCP